MTYAGKCGIYRSKTDFFAEKNAIGRLSDGELDIIIRLVVDEDYELPQETLERMSDSDLYELAASFDARARSQS
jgi:hypothetical protein